MAEFVYKELFLFLSEALPLREGSPMMLQTEARLPGLPGPRIAMEWWRSQRMRSSPMLLWEILRAKEALQDDSTEKIGEFHT